MVRLSVTDNRIERTVDYIHCPWLIPAVASLRLPLSPNCPTAPCEQANATESFRQRIGLIFSHPATIWVTTNGNFARFRPM
jgi:hypothetical protein